MPDWLQSVRTLLETEIETAGPYFSTRYGEESDSSPEPGAVPVDGETSARAVSEAAVGGVPAPAVPEGLSALPRLEALIPVHSPLRAMQSLGEVEQFVASARLIALDETRLNPVFGVGNPRAELMVIGEAPGADEDRQGEPFVGRAGQLLDKILEATGFSRAEVYIANILKSRPPRNRDPLPAEIAAHVPILYKQICLIQPRMLLSVGRISACTLTGTQASLASLRGRVHDFHGVPLVVTYHPAALLRNPEWKRPTWEDMQFLRRHFDHVAASA